MMRGLGRTPLRRGETSKPQHNERGAVSGAPLRSLVTGPLGHPDHSLRGFRASDSGVSSWLGLDWSLELGTSLLVWWLGAWTLVIPPQADNPFFVRVGFQTDQIVARGGEPEAKSQSLFRQGQGSVGIMTNSETFVRRNPFFVRVRVNYDRPGELPPFRQGSVIPSSSGSGFRLTSLPKVANAFKADTSQPLLHQG